MSADVCKNICNVRFGAGRLGLAAAPSVVKKAIGKLGMLFLSIESIFEPKSFRKTK